ncbi:glutamate receptor ionotropic, kainate 2-like isoform X2 [Cimex lectularius]|uniref:Glutamate receptor 1 n=1 Tax=Cimex lectularius TaxID=79782 RepID=A0A8I6RPB0_CIMLE|nr:glutamate receptor ionotropic, kainate 2-like isoform X2 [Cimex lectularius]
MFILFAILCTQLVLNGGHEMPFVAFFLPNQLEQEISFKLSAEILNKDTDLAGMEIIPKIEHMVGFDSFNMSKSVCRLMGEGIAGLIGPQSLETASILHAISNKFHLPLIQTHWDIISGPETFSEATVNIYPDPDLIAKGLIAIVEDMDWGSYTIIYEKEEALIRLQGILKAHNKGLTAEGHVPFTAWQLEGDDYRPILKEIEQSTETHIILDCSTDKIIDILEQAKQVNMMGDYHSYVLTALDAHTIDFGDFKAGKTNITTLRLVDPGRAKVQNAVQDLKYYDKMGFFSKLSPDNVPTEVALLYDSLSLLAYALKQLRDEIKNGMTGDNNEDVENLRRNNDKDEDEDEEGELGIVEDGGDDETLIDFTDAIDCKSDNFKKYGKRLGEIIKNTEMEGMTGKIKFDEKGRRIFATVDITELTKSRQIGSWNPEDGISYTRTKSQMESDMFQSLSNKTFIVVSRLGEPYLRIANDSLEGNDRFEGYSKDLIAEIANELNFKFQFVLTPDREYGSFNKETKQWNGLIRELRERRADLAICDLTITYERRSAVDFTMPFMTLGISILFSKPTKQPPNLFSFLSPLSLDVWIYMATSFLGVSLLLYFLARISPLEWKNPHPCQSEPDEYENDLSMQNVIWHNCGSLMQQGSDIAPQAISTRTVAGMWWFFVLIMISSYTANLAAFLTMERMDEQIKSVEDLAKQSKIKYGVLNGGSSMNFFKNSNDTLYQKMWSVMDSTRPSVFTKSNDEGVERVLKGKRAYAFFMESTSIEYQMEKHCELTQVGRLLDSKGYGIAMPFNSPYRTAISGAVLKMQESGKLLQLKTKWWQHGKAECETEEGGGDSAELGIDNVGGVFLVLIVGCAVAFFVAILEFLWNIRKVAVQEKISLKHAFMAEFKFAINCSESTKPVRHTAEDDDSKDDDDEEKSLKPRKVSYITDDYNEEEDKD